MKTPEQIAMERVRIHAQSVQVRLRRWTEVYYNDGWNSFGKNERHIRRAIASAIRFDRRQRAQRKGRVK